MFNVIEYNNEPSGIVRLDQIDHKKFEVSIYIAPEWQGKGLASIGLKLAHNMFPFVDMMADIHPQNVASQRLFRNQGYRQVDERTYLRELA